MSRVHYVSLSGLAFVIEDARVSLLRPDGSTVPSTLSPHSVRQAHRACDADTALSASRAYFERHRDTAESD